MAPRFPAVTSVMAGRTSSPQRWMSHGSSDGRGADDQSGAGGRDSGRVVVLSRASAAIRRAHLDGDGAHETGNGAEAALGTTAERAARDAERAAREELEAHVREWAARLRSEGAPPEVAVRRLKAAMEPALFSSRDHDGTDVEWRRTVIGDAVRWFVESYYSV